MHFVLCILSIYVCSGCSNDYGPIKKDMKYICAFWSGLMCILEASL